MWAKVTMISILSMLSLGAIDVVAAAENTDVLPTQTVLPAKSPAGTSTDVPSLSTTATGKKKITHKKEGILTVSPLRTQMTDEDYSKLGPGGTPTPVCPVDDSLCPDINGKVNGVLVSAAVAAAQCPAVCAKTRTGNLTADMPAICPTGYIQIGMYNAQPEYIINPNPGWDPVPTNDRATFLSYWNDPAKYWCKNDRSR